jgi:AcrR family transcriptional regulator
MGRKAIKNIEKKILGEVMKEAFKNGIAAVSTKEVAHKLHISEPVIFAHFETKQNLMVKTFEEAWNALPHTVAFPASVKPRRRSSRLPEIQRKGRDCPRQSGQVDLYRRFLFLPLLLL